MTTLNSLVDKVSSQYLNRFDFTAEVTACFLSTIRQYERQRTRFNQTSTAITSSAGQSFLALPANFLVLDLLEITYSGSRYELSAESLAHIRSMNATSVTGVPTHFTLYNDQIELALVPNSAYSFPLHYIKTLTELTGGASNSWTEGAWQDIITYGATKNFYLTILRNGEEAQKFAALEALVLSTITKETEQFLTTKLKPTSF